MQIHFTVTGHGLDHPQTVDLLVPQQNIRHGVSEHERHASRGQGRTLSFSDTISVTIVNIDDLVIWQESWSIVALAYLDEVAVFGAYSCSCQLAQFCLQLETCSYGILTNPLFEAYLPLGLWSRENFPETA